MTAAAAEALWIRCDCGLQLAIDPAQAGASGPCPLCGEYLQAPSTPGPAPAGLEPAPALAHVPALRAEASGPLRFSCGSCHQELVVPAKQAGMVGPCPACDQPVRATNPAREAALATPRAWVPLFDAEPLVGSWDAIELQRLPVETRPCPRCRQPINVYASACRHARCGARMRPQASHEARALTSGRDDLRRRAWLLLISGGLGVLTVNPLLAVSATVGGLRLRPALAGYAGGREATWALLSGLLGLLICGLLLWAGINPYFTR